MIKIWDSHNKQLLKPMSIIFDHNNQIGRIDACVPGANPLSDGFYTLEGDDLKKISIIGELSLNSELFPEKYK